MKGGFGYTGVCHFCGPDQHVAVHIPVCGACAQGYCASCEACKHVHRSRLDAARALLTELAENGLTPYREKIRAWLADED